MKYSNYVGAIAALLLIACCFLPWVYIKSVNITITGLSTEGTSYGKPGILHIAFCILSIILFLIPKVWAKRTLVFVAAFNLAWAVRNFLLITHCELGECPQRFIGIYAIPLISILVLVMALFPKIDLK